MSDAPYRDELPTIEVVVATAGSLKTRYRLTARELVAERVDKPGTARSIALADATRVELVTLGGTTICTVRTAGNKLEVGSGMEPMAPGSEREREFFALLEPLNERVALASPNAAFVAGSWTVVGGFAAMLAIGAGAVAAMSQTSLRDSWKFTAALAALAIAVLVALPITIVRGRPRPYDPRKVPRVYDPMHGRG